METGTMAALIAQFGTQITAMIGWVGEVITLIVSQPLLLMFTGFAIFRLAVSSVNSLKS